MFRRSRYVWTLDYSSEEEQTLGAELIMVEVIKVDPDTNKSASFNVRVPKGTIEKMLEQLKPALNVGDFAIFEWVPENLVYIRVRGGFRKATDEEMAELISSRM